MADARARLQSFRLRALLGPGDRAGPGLSPHVPAARAGRSRSWRIRRGPRRVSRVTAVDWLLVALSAMALLWPVVQGQAFELRAATPSTIDVALGLVLLLVVLEATRRTTGLMLPVTAALFLVYALGRAGARPRGPVAHRPSRVLAGPNRRDALRHARGRAGRAARRGRHLHRAVHDLRRGGRTRRRGPLLPGLVDGRHGLTRRG